MEAIPIAHRQVRGHSVVVDPDRMHLQLEALQQDVLLEVLSVFRASSLQRQPKRAVQIVCSDSCRQSSRAGEWAAREP